MPEIANNISADDFVDLLLSFSSMTDEQMQKERRTLARVGIGARVSIIACDHNPGREALPGVLRDISQGGVGIIHTFPMDLGQRFIICSGHPGAGINSAMLCTVVRCRPIDHRHFEIGATFVRKLASDN
jgi:hypothetical protein